jgi:rod shape-determining protein MreC
LLVLLVGQLVLIASQVTAEDGRRSQLEALGIRFAAPVVRLAQGALGLIDEQGSRFQSRGGLVRDNEALREEVEALRLELTRLHGLDKEAERLADALDFARQERGDLRVAEIIYLDTHSWLRNMLVYAGRDDVEVNQPVLATDGLVGRVVQVSGPYARVQLLTDTAASVSAMIERTGRQALVQGTSGGALEIIYMPLQAEVRVGDLVVTAGIDGVYPRGIPIGTVLRVDPGNELFHRILLEPAVQLDRLDRVYTLARAGLPETLQEPPRRANP